MEIGAVLMTAGCGGAAALPSGSITVAQRMIASLKKAGITVIAVVTGPEDKKFEKQLAQAGVVFLNTVTPDDENASIRLGLEYLADKCREVFVLQANHPLLAPETLVEMCNTPGASVVPVYADIQGQPLLLRSPFSEIRSLKDVIIDRVLNVDDRGILLTARDSENLADAIAEHDRKLTRPVLDFSIARGKQLLDSKLVMLLHLIQETQSVREACGRMQISYSAAWNLLNAAEDSLGYPLVKRNKGGPSGLGTLLTEKGSRLLSAYDLFESQARESIEQLYNTYLKHML